jgi:predicted regulator of Ras-like GTPase activity (Roadblock/LC7/MglB family)
MAMRGSLRDMAVADLIQHNCQDRKTAQLSIEHDGCQALLFFKDGAVVHATLDDLQGEEVIYRILEWEVGQFGLETGVEPPAATISRSWSSLLLEGARRLDETGLENEPIISEVEANKMAQIDDILKQMGGEVGGFIAAAVVGMDGLNIAQHARGKTNPEAIGAQMTLLFKLVDTSVTKLDAGVVEDDLVTTDNAYILMRYLPDKHYFLGMAADRKSANLGNMRLMSRMYVDRIAKAMPH